MTEETIDKATKLKRQSSHLIDEATVQNFNLTRPENRRDKICYAPFKSLLFTPSGNAMACHDNRGLSLGKYPENTIKEIWFGPVLQELRKRLDNKDFSMGCQNCHHNIINGQYHMAGAWKHDYLEDNDEGYPVLLDLQIDNTCNYECVMCSGEYSSLIRKNREEGAPYKSPFDSGFVEQVKEFLPHLKGINFTGGEPFLIKVYYEMWDQIIALNPDLDIYIHTNGSVLNDKIKGYLKKLKFNFTVSIDSIDKKNYESIRINGDLKRVMSNIEYFNDYTLKHERSFHVKFCIMQNNINELPSFVNYFNEKNISVLMKPVWLPSKYSVRDWSSEKLREVIQHLSAHTFRSDTHFQALNNRRYKEVINQLGLWANEKERSIEAPQQDEFLSAEQVFFNRLKDYIYADPNMSNDQKMEKWMNCESMGQEVIKSIPDSAKLTKALKSFNNLPVNMVLAELDRGGTEILTARFIQEAS